MPYIDFTTTSENKGSVGKLTNYLTKEDERLDVERREGREYFFSVDREYVTKAEVDKHIDTNRGGLKKKDAKFYMITINPSQKELAHIGNDSATFKKWIQEAYIPQLAKDFHRKGLAAKGLNCYAKIEHHRYYKGTDEAVLNGEAKSGEPKAGHHLHCHIILGRKSLDKKHYLSPNANARRKGQQGAAKNAGFDRNAHKISIEQSFDKTFGYNRGLNESFEVQQGFKQAVTLEDKKAVITQFEAKKEKTIVAKKLKVIQQEISLDISF